MRVLTALLTASIAGSAYTQEVEASVYIFDRHTQHATVDTPVPTVDPSTARLLLAYRLGLSQYHTLESPKESTLNLLDTFGGVQTPLFGQTEKSESTAKLLVLIEGVEDTAELFGDAYRPSYTISNPPHSSSNIQLITDLFIQDTYLRRNVRACSSTIPEHVEVPSLVGGINSVDVSGACNKQVFLSSIPADASDLRGLDTLHRSIQSQQSESACDDSTGIVHVSTLETIAQNEGRNSASFRQAVSKLKAIITELREHSLKQNSILVLLPPNSRRKDRHQDSYGFYKVPTNSLQARQAYSEAPLSSDDPLSKARPEPKGKAVKQLLPSSQRKATLPLCHDTESSCKTATGNCSGHGSCFAKDVSGNATDQRQCWACSCNKKGTIRKNKDGTIKTTYWGGPACSKEDISAPFLLLVGFTVAIVAALTWGIGLMYSIGQEDLPSVIGAGVSGPRAQK